MAKGGSGFAKSSTARERELDAVMPKGCATEWWRPGSPGYRRGRPRFTAGHCSTRPRQEPWRARCGESRTPGSVSGLGKRTSSNAGTAPQADSTQTAQVLVGDENLRVWVGRPTARPRRP